MNPKEMTGLQLMQALSKGLIPMPSIAQTMPMIASEVEHGQVTFLVTADERHTNPLGGVHGGFAATVIDSITGCATHTVLAAGEGYGTTDLNVKMCRPLPFKKQLIATGRVINIGRNLVISEGHIRDEDGKLYAYGNATCMIVR